MMHDWSLQTALGLKQAIRQWARELGFAAVGVASPQLGEAGNGLADWLARGYHGDMDYMARHADKRAHPASLLPGTRSILCVRLDYAAAPGTPAPNPVTAPVSCYARGRDYHKVVRGRLKKLAGRIESEVGPFTYRAFSDSAPVLEVELASRAGLGWRGKHTLLLNRQGSWSFLGELFTDLPLPPDLPAAGHCGRCTACLDNCPTGAFVAPYVLDARRCISYLTIEHAGPIPEPLRPLLGSHIYGCDDCQQVCPWNRHAQAAALDDFLPRNRLDQADLIEWFAWTETDFNDRLAGSPIRRIGHERWRRNIAIALGNGPPSTEASAALEARRDDPSPLVREHVRWALARLAG